MRKIKEMRRTANSIKRHPVLAIYVRVGTEAWRKNGLRAGNDFWQGDPS